MCSGGMICYNGLIIVLSLVTLSAGIAVFELLGKRSSSSKPKYKRSNNLRPLVEKGDGDGEKEDAGDVISELPDEALIPVIFFRDVNFNCLHMFGLPYDGSHWNEFYDLQKRFIARADTFFHRHCSYTKMRSVTLSCCFARSFPNKLNQWICKAGKLGVEKLTLSFRCSVSNVTDPVKFSFQLQLLPQVPSLEYLELHACSLKPNLKSQCYSLKTLHLRDVTLVPSAVECILSNCLNLQTLVIRHCELHPKLRICGPNLQLEVLSVEDTEVKEIELYASNLMTFECSHSKMIKFSFDYVPKLQNFSASLYSEEVMPFLYNKLVTDLPQLNSLIFQTSGKFYQEMRSPSGVAMFNNLRQLVLAFYNIFKSDIFSLSLVLEMCPLLQEFHLVTNMTHISRKQVKRNVLFDSKLKKVEWSGFSGTDNEVSFAKYILKSARILEQMYIGINFQYYRGFGRWDVDRAIKWSDDKREMICEWLQRQAISKSAQVIFRP